MAYENPPFPRGQTLVNGAYTISSSDLPGLSVEGKEWLFEDIDLNSSSGQVKPHRTNHRVRCVAVRNTSSVAMRPKAIVTFAATAGLNRSRVDGMCDVTAEKCCGVVDEYLSSTGIIQYDIGWVVVEGPSLMLTSLSGDATNVFDVGTIMVALTAASSGATTAGRPAPQDLTGATATLAAQIQGRVGEAMSAKTTAQTNSDILAYVKCW